MRLRLLRVFLGFSACAWGVSVFGVFLEWPAASQALQGLGAQPIDYDPMLDYWLRMGAGAFTLIGCWYLVLMIWPAKFHSAIPWFGGFMLVEGIVLLVHGVRLSLPPLPFYGDTAACFLGGGGILYLSPSAKPSNANNDRGRSPLARPLASLFFGLLVFSGCRAPEAIPGGLERINQALERRVTRDEARDFVLSFIDGLIADLETKLAYGVASSRRHELEGELDALRSHRLRRDAQLNLFLSRVYDGDELWVYRTYAISGERRGGENGLARVRNGKVLEHWPYLVFD